jgi:cysteine synthase A
MSNIVTSLPQLIGHTPLFEAVRYETLHHLSAHLLLKLEYLNPTGSIKDRAAWNMIETAEREGKIAPGDTIVEQTSGNTGIALAAFAVPRGYSVKIFLERGASAERRQMLVAYGATLLDYKDALGLRDPDEPRTEWVDPEREATLKEIDAYCRRQTRRHYFINQVTNPANPAAHEQSTGPEIWQDTDGAVDILVCMAGTGGTARGLATYLREKNPQVKIVMVQPAESSRLTPEHPYVTIIDGVLPFHGVPAEEVTDFVSEDLYDECLDVTTEEAYAAARELIRTDGLFMGTSAAASFYAAARLAARPENAGKNIIVIMPDNGMKYLTTPMFREGTDPK